MKGLPDCGLKIMLKLRETFNIILLLWFYWPQADTFLVVVVCKVKILCLTEVSPALPQGPPLPSYRALPCPPPGPPLPSPRALPFPPPAPAKPTQGITESDGISISIESWSTWGSQSFHFVFLIYVVPHILPLSYLPLASSISVSFHTRLGCSVFFFSIIFNLL